MQERQSRYCSKKQLTLLGSSWEFLLLIMSWVQPYFSASCLNARPLDRLTATVSCLFSWGLPGPGGLSPCQGIVPLFTLNLSLQLQYQAIRWSCGRPPCFPWLSQVCCHFRVLVLPCPALGATSILARADPLQLAWSHLRLLTKALPLS